MIKHKPKILMLTQFGMIGGSSRIQVLQFIPHIEQAGFICSVRYVYPDIFWNAQMGTKKVSKLIKFANLFLFLTIGLLKKIWFALTAWMYDGILIQKETFPKSVFLLMKFFNSRIAYEMDDTIFELNPYHNKGIVMHFLLWQQARLCKFMMRHAFCGVAENEYIADEYHKHNKDVSLVTAPIDINRIYPHVTQKLPGEKIIIGWIGSPSTTYMLENIKPALERLGVMHKNVALKTVGARLDFSVSRIEYIKKDWKLEDELSDLQSFDIGLMPLDDSPFNRGRLGYKMIQYMAVGVPIIANNLGLNKTVVTNGYNGYLVSDEEEWVSALSKLVLDSNLRHILGANGRKMAEEKFSIEANAKVWVDVISHLIS